MTRIWLDDMREPPRNWGWARTVHELITILSVTPGPWVLSLDYDLGVNKENGYDFVRWLQLKIHEELVTSDQFTVFIHSQNPVGCIRMRIGLEACGIYPVIGWYR